MTITMTTRFFNEQWMRDNAPDVIRAREQHLAAVMAEARRKLATMTCAEFVADAMRNIAEADEILGLLAKENADGAN